MHTPIPHHAAPPALCINIHASPIRAPLPRLQAAPNASPLPHPIRRPWGYAFRERGWILMKV